MADMYTPTCLLMVQRHHALFINGQRAPYLVFHWQKPHDRHDDKLDVRPNAWQRGEGELLRNNHAADNMLFIALQAL
jgi:hypothetical protein